MINKPDEDKKVTMANELSDDDMNAVSGGVRGILLAFVIIFELAVAAFTANCEYALFR